MTPHINSKKEDIAKTILCPGDPLRAKYIAENFLENPRLVNSVRNILAYTGTYKGKEITVFASGMGMPSMGIYCYELYKFYDVDTIIRIGSCGAYDKNLNLMDTILVNKSYTEGNFAMALNNSNCHLVEASPKLNKKINDTANKLNIKCIETNVLCSECFDYYIDDINVLLNRLPKDLNITAAEMEAFALFYTAKYLNKNAACLLTVVDSHHNKQEISTEAREKSLNNMIILALESIMEE
ncbi:MAG: purine-nucleoside phosphorylase [Clostridiales bacterium]|nr:purine-nucleoside phosphorylase [Clostridiales bacterium]